MNFYNHNIFNALTFVDQNQLDFISSYLFSMFIILLTFVDFYSTPSDIDLRVGIRTDFQNLGLQETIEVRYLQLPIIDLLVIQKSHD
jgi:hypothetical protein